MVTSLVPRNHDLCPKTAWPGGSWYMILLRVICFPVSFLLAVNPLLGTISWMCSQTKNTQQRIRSSPGLQVLFDTHTHTHKNQKKQDDVVSSRFLSFTKRRYPHCPGLPQSRSSTSGPHSAFFQLGVEEPGWSQRCSFKAPVTRGLELPECLAG